jgi:uncharacterized protein (TIGR00299 family) protein
MGKSVQHQIENTFRHVHLDVVGGAAGDMMTAAFCHAYPELIPLCQEIPHLLRAPVGFEVHIERCDKFVMTGIQVHVRRNLESGRTEEEGYAPLWNAESQPFSMRTVQHNETHEHTPVMRIQERIQRSALSEPIKQNMLHMLQLLAEAEGAVHGADPLFVELHEVGAWDALIDIACVATALDYLHIQSCTVTQLPKGGGMVNTAHGRMPVPTPAVALLLQGMQFYDDGVEGERITPTGAVILRHMQAKQESVPQGRLGHTGYGFGHKIFDGFDNFLRMSFYDVGKTKSEHQDRVGKRENLVEITADLDDQDGEDLEIALSYLRTLEGVHDVSQWFGLGKKGRQNTRLTLLVKEGREDIVAMAVLNETSTIGVRMHKVERICLERENIVRQGMTDELSGKLVCRPDGENSAKVDSDILRTVRGYAQRQKKRAELWRMIEERKLD